MKPEEESTAEPLRAEDRPEQRPEARQQDLVLAVAQLVPHLAEAQLVRRLVAVQPEQR